MPSMTSSQLRQEIAKLNSHHSTADPAIAYESTGGVILFKSDLTSSTHGNFIDASYAAILQKLKWQARFCKPHPQRSALRSPYNVTARELDSSNSSDALLMNVFCYPDVMKTSLAELLKVSPTAELEFGFKAGVPLQSGKGDSSEVDLKIDDLLIEAKFTEADFTDGIAGTVHKYRDFTDVFDTAKLPQANEKYQSYQLIRNVLAAHASESRFLLLYDERRLDLLEAWKNVHAAIQSSGLQARCSVLTWQEIARVIPQALAQYLADSRGIFPHENECAPIRPQFQN